MEGYGDWKRRVSENELAGMKSELSIPSLSWKWSNPLLKEASYLCGQLWDACIR